MVGRETARQGEAASGAERQVVKARIETAYGFTPTDAYVADLIAFVDGVLAEAEGQKRVGGKRRRK